MAAGSSSLDVSVLDAEADAEGENNAVTLVSDFCSEVSDRSIQNLLTEQLTRLQQVLTDNHARASSLVERKMDAIRQVESELADLRAENQKLKIRLESAGLPSSLIETGHGMGGTGESSSGPKPAIFTMSPVRAAEGAEQQTSSRGREPAAPPRVPVEPISEPRDTAPVMSVPGAPVINLPGAVSMEDMGTSQIGVPQAQQAQHDVRAGVEDRVEVSPRQDNQRWDGFLEGSAAAPEVISVVPRPAEGQGQPKGPGGRLSSNSPLPDADGHLAVQKLSIDEGTLSQGISSKSLRASPSGPVSASSQRSLTKSLGLPSYARGPRKSVAVMKQQAQAIKAEVVGTAEAPKAVFADAAAMKEKLRQALHAPEYNVADYYHETGFWQKIARSSVFEHITLGVIAFNAVWIAVDTDYNKSEDGTLLKADVGFQVAEHAFCSYFTFEWIVRFMSFKKKRNCLRDGWFVFDTALVSLMVFETWVLTLVFIVTAGGNSSGVGNVSILRMLRLLRLTRMARMARLLRAMPELMILIKGMTVAARSVFFTLILLLVFIYVFAIAFVQLLDDSDMKEEYFRTVPKSMSTLLLDGTLPDHEEIVSLIATENWIYGAVFLFYMLLGSLTVMNMLVGVLVEVVSVVSSVEKEQMVVNFVKVQLQQMMQTSGLDANHDNLISKSEFQTLLEKPEAARALQDVGVDVVGLVDFTDFIFKDGVELSFPNFMEMVLQLRGSNTATVKDIVDFRKFVMNELGRLEEKVSQKIMSALASPMAGLRGLTPIQNISMASGSASPNRGARYSQAEYSIGFQDTEKDVTTTPSEM